jgi:site-specific DNA-adenine methylase
VFSYYGSKSKLIKLYSPPEYDTIIEPFAGSARYALEYAEHNCILIEINPVIYRIWRWLIKEATLNDIRRLPTLRRGDDLRKMSQLSDVERDLLGFAAGCARSTPGNIVTAWADASGRARSDPKYRPKNASELLKERLLNNLSRIKHWKILNCSYENFKPNYEATWFIDPPYQNSAGRCYTYSDVNYDHLGKWCETRKGQVIVCEGAGANWLPFKPLKTSERGTWRTLVEMVYERNSNA